MKHKVVAFNCFLLVLFASLTTQAAVTTQNFTNPSIEPTTEALQSKELEQATHTDVTDEPPVFIENGAKLEQNEKTKDLEIEPEPENNVTTTVAPDANITTTPATIPTTVTVEPPSTVTEHSDNVTTTIFAPNTTVTPEPTTVAPETTTASPEPVPTTMEPIVSTTVAPEKPRRFDGASFIGGMILAIGLMCIGLVAWKFYRARTERNYHTL